MNTTLVSPIFSAQKIGTDRQGNIITFFNRDEYSKFKFGCKDIARKFGYELADKFAESIAGNAEFHKKQIVVASSAYTHIPTACFAMKDYFIQRLNLYMVSVGFPVLQETKITRTATYSKDYGSMSADARRKLLKDDRMHIDSEFVRDKILILMDDIKVTGAHQELMERMVERQSLKCEELIYMYYAEIIDPTINPKFEDELNYSYVKSLLDLDSVIKNENFLLNTRTVKYILRAPAEEFIPFISYQKRSLVNTIYHQAIGNGYHLLEIYQPNLEYIKYKIQIDK